MILFFAVEQAEDCRQIVELVILRARLEEEHARLKKEQERLKEELARLQEEYARLLGENKRS